MLSAGGIEPGRCNVENVNDNSELVTTWAISAVRCWALL